MLSEERGGGLVWFLKSEEELGIRPLWLKDRMFCFWEEGSLEEVDIFRALKVY